MIAAADAREPVVICSGCRADSMSCEVKRGLSGRRCCADCGHDDDRRDGDDHVDHGAEDVVDHGRLRTCNGCGADSLACARKSAFGGRACCDACTHVTTRKVQR